VGLRDEGGVFLMVWVGPVGMESEEADLRWRNYDIEELHDEVAEAKMQMEVMIRQPDTRLCKTRFSECSLNFEW
jgi:hypothetical protein